MSDFRSRLREKNAKKAAKPDVENVQDNGLGDIFLADLKDTDIKTPQNTSENDLNGSKIDSKDVSTESFDFNPEPLKNENNAVSVEIKDEEQKSGEKNAESVGNKHSANIVVSVESVETATVQKDEIVQKGIKNTSNFEKPGSSEPEKSTSDKFNDFVEMSATLMKGDKSGSEKEEGFVEKNDKKANKNSETTSPKKEAHQKESAACSQPSTLTKNDGRKPLTDVKCSNDERMPTTSWNCMIDPELDIRFRYEVQMRDTTIIELINRILLQEKQWEMENPGFITKEYVLENIKKSRNKKTEGRVALSLGLLPESWDYLKTASKKRGLKMNSFIEFLLETYC